MEDQAYCFVCDESLLDNGVQLSMEQTSRSKTGLPTKISQIMGENFMVVFTVDDRICQRCSELLNHFDKLEADLGDVRLALTGYLNKKYNLLGLADEESPVQDSDEELPADDSIEYYSSRNQLNDSYDASDTTVNNHSINNNSTVNAGNSDFQSAVNTIIKQCLPVYRCTLCPFVTSHQQAYLTHSKKCKKLTYKCSICETKFENPQQIRRHIMVAHLSNWPCHFCGITFSDQTEYTSHMKIHLSNTSYDPPQPQIEPGLRKNVLGNYECNFCLFKTKNKAVLHAHTRKHEPKELKCEQCLTNFENKDDFNAHKCNNDDYVLTVKSQSDFDDDLQVNNDEISIDESVNTGRNSAIAWNNNAGAQIPEEDEDQVVEFHQCQTCCLTFIDENVLIQHLKTHEEHQQDIDEQNSVASDGTMGSNYSEEEQNLENVFERIHSDEHSASNLNEQSADNHVNFFTTLNVESSKTDEGVSSIESTLILSSNTQGSDVDTHESHNSSQIAEHTDTVSDNIVCGKLQSSKINSNKISELVRAKKLSSVNLNYHNIDFLTFDTNVTSQDSEAEGEQLTIPNSIMETFVEPMNMKKFFCATCNYQSLDEEDLKLHFEKHKDDKSYTCSICNRKLSSSQKLSNHQRSHQKSPGILVCPYCNDEFADKFHLQQHIQENHQRDKTWHLCTYCDQQFPSKKAVKLHEESHPERFSIQCETCNQLFTREKQLKAHIELEHRDPHCRFCGKEILKAKTLKYHEKRHLREEESYDCANCTRTFKTKTGLKNHSAVHSGIYTYTCEFCQRGFMSRMMLEEHRSKHTKEERYVCDICGKKFIFQSTYWIHHRWHFQAFPYKCTTCNRMFRHSSLLAVHKRKHTGERPYKCSYCPLTFAVSGTLKRHLILHTGVYPYNCEECKRGFTTKHKYVTHRVKIHEEVELLTIKTQDNDFRMAVRDLPETSEQTSGGELMDWVVEAGDDTEPGFIFKIGTNGGVDCSEIIMQDTDELIPCTVITDNILVDDMGNTQMVQIVLDETSQAIASVSEENNVSILSDLWSYQ